MVEVYFYLPGGNVGNAVECGIKLSEWYSKEVLIEGDRKKCISALLNPRDDAERYVSSDYKCLKLEIMPKYCFAADSLLYQVGLNNPEVMDMYYRSIIPIEQYNFGRFRLPECLVTSTVISDYVSILDKRLDSPILFNNSEELYVGNIIEAFKEKHGDFNDALLYYFFSKLADTGVFRKIEDKLAKTAVFSDTRSGQTYTVRIPDLEGF